MINKNKFKGFMLLIAERENREISHLLMDAYWETLKPFSDEQCEKAFTHVWNNTRFFPKPVDFLEYLAPKPKRFDEIDFPGHVYQDPPTRDYLQDDRTEEQKDEDMAKLRKMAGNIGRSIE